MWDPGYTDETERDQARRLAEARQQLAHEGCHLPTWGELTDHERELAMLDARNYLRAARRCGLIAPDTPRATT
jgi:hypothetical protein